MSDTDRLLDAGELAAVLHVPVSWVRQESREGRIPCVRLGRYVRFDRSDVLAWVERQKAGGSTINPRKHRPQMPV